MTCWLAIARATCGVSLEAAREVADPAVQDRLAELSWAPSEISEVECAVVRRLALVHLGEVAWSQGIDDQAKHLDLACAGGTPTTASIVAAVEDLCGTHARWCLESMPTFDDSTISTQGPQSLSTQELLWIQAVTDQTILMAASAPPRAFFCVAESLTGWCSSRTCRMTHRRPHRACIRSICETIIEMPEEICEEFDALTLPRSRQYILTLGHTQQATCFPNALLASAIFSDVKLYAPRDHRDNR